MADEPITESFDSAQDLQPTPTSLEPQTAQTEAPVQQADPVPVDMPSVTPEAPASPEDPVSLKDDNSANEPLNQPLDEAQDKPLEPEKTAQNNEQIPETPISQANSSSVQDSGGTKPNITIEKHGTDTTITEVIQPPAPTAPEPPDSINSPQATAQMVANEPLPVSAPSSGETNVK